MCNLLQKDQGRVWAELAVWESLRSYVPASTHWPGYRTEGGNKCTTLTRGLTSRDCSDLLAWYQHLVDRYGGIPWCQWLMLICWVSQFLFPKLCSVETKKGFWRNVFKKSGFTGKGWNKVWLALCSDSKIFFYEEDFFVSLDKMQKTPLSATIAISNISISSGQEFPHWFIPNP